MKLTIYAIVEIYGGCFQRVIPFADEKTRDSELYQYILEALGDEAAELTPEEFIDAYHDHLGYTDEEEYHADEFEVDIPLSELLDSVPEDKCSYGFIEIGEYFDNMEWEFETQVDLHILDGEVWAHVWDNPADLPEFK